MYSSANTVISAGIRSLGAGIFTALLTSAPTIPHTAIPQVGIFTHLWVYGGIAGIVMLALALLERRLLYAMHASFVGGGPAGSGLCRSGRCEGLRSSR